MNESTSNNIQTLPLFPLRGSTLFPYVLAPYAAGRPRSIAALEAALASKDKLLAVISQKDATVETPRYQDLYAFGTRAVIKRMARSDETMEVILQGLERVRVTALQPRGDYLESASRRCRWCVNPARRPWPWSGN